MQRNYLEPPTAILIKRITAFVDHIFCLFTQCGMASLPIFFPSVGPMGPCVCCTILTIWHAAAVVAMKPQTEAGDRYIAIHLHLEIAFAFSQGPDFR